MRHTSGDGSTSPSSLGARARSSVPQLPRPARGPEGLAGGAGSELEGLLTSEWFLIERDAEGRAISLKPMPNPELLIPVPYQSDVRWWHLALAYLVLAVDAARREIDRGLEEDTVHLLLAITLIGTAVVIMARALGIQVLPGPDGWRLR